MTGRVSGKLRLACQDSPSGALKLTKARKAGRRRILKPGEQAGRGIYKV